MTVLRIETLAPAVGKIETEDDWVPVGSGVDWDSTAVLVIVPELAFTCTVMVAVALPPFAKVPTVQVMVAPQPLMEPVAVASLTQATPAGSESETLTLAAASGPAFVRCRV